MGIIIWLEGTKLYSEIQECVCFPNEGGQQHLVRVTKGQLNGKEKGGYRAESEKESRVK